MAGDTKLTGLTQLVTPSVDDIMYIVDSPGGTPASRYIKASDLSNWILPFFNIETYGSSPAVPDDYYADGVSNTSTTFTSATANFTAADIGKNIFITRAGASSLQDHHTTIASVESTTSCTLTNPTGRSQSGCRFYLSRSGGQATAIQTVIDAATAAGGGTVFCPGVGYLIDASLVLGNRVVLCGAGMQATVLHLGASVNAPVIRNDYTSQNSANFCAVRDMWVDGNRSRQSNTTTTLSSGYTAGGSTLSLTDSTSFLPSGEVLIGSTRFTYQANSSNQLTTVVGGTEGTDDANQSNGATVTQHKCIGIYFAVQPYNTQGTTEEAYDPHWLVDNVHVKNCKGEGVFFSGQAEGRINNVWAQYCDHASIRPSFDCWVSNCTSDTAGRMGFYTRGSEAKFTNCKAFYSGGNTASEGWGFMVDGATTIEEGTKVLSSCGAQDNKAEGFYFRYAERVMLQATSSSNGTSQPGNYAGIKLDGCKDCIIDIACTERKQDGTNICQIYGIEFAETNGIINDKNQIRLTHGGTQGVAVGPAIKPGSLLSGGNNILINGMGGTIFPALPGNNVWTPDPYSGTVQNLATLTGNLTVNAPSNAHVGCELEVRLVQDSVGGRTVSWNSIFVFNPAYVNDNNVAGNVFRARFRFDGNYWNLVWMSQSPAALGDFWC
jgi:hypothetical protein